MQLRNKKTGRLAFSNSFNIHAMSEIIVGYEDGDADSAYIKDFDVLINNEWHDLNEAFKTKLLITDNYNAYFFPPANDEEKERGYRL